MGVDEQVHAAHTLSTEAGMLVLCLKWSIQNVPIRRHVADELVCCCR